jgi:hypothetical protein
MFPAVPYIMHCHFPTRRLKLYPQIPALPANTTLLEKHRHWFPGHRLVSQPSQVASCVCSEPHQPALGWGVLVKEQHRRFWCNFVVVQQVMVVPCWLSRFGANMRLSRGGLSGQFRPVAKGHNPSAI